MTEPQCHCPMHILCHFHLGRLVFIVYPTPLDAECDSSFLALLLEGPRFPTVLHLICYPTPDPVATTLWGFPSPTSAAPQLLAEAGLQTFHHLGFSSGFLRLSFPQKQKAKFTSRVVKVADSLWIFRFVSSVTILGLSVFRLLQFLPPIPLVSFHSLYL